MAGSVTIEKMPAYIDEVSFINLKDKCVAGKLFLSGKVVKQGESNTKIQQNKNIDYHSMFNAELMQELRTLPQEDVTQQNNNIQPVNVEDPAVEVISEDSSFIRRFYHGKKIFITGGTGFLGKILLEKLLRCCPGIDTIYLLVRVKKGKDVYTRIDDLLSDSIFERLKDEMPKFRHKIEIVCGDCEQSGLGLSLIDRKLLIDNVDIVFHGAATVRFDERLRTALAINVRAVTDIIRLAQEMKKLKALMYISTAYSNCHLETIEEKFYECPVRYTNLADYIANMTDSEIDATLTRILGEWPNTYAFTKALAEREIRDMANNLPIAIFRPAIVTSVYKDPIPGWIDNLYGPTGVVAGAAMGLLRTLHCDGNVSAEIVPVDMVVNCLIAAAREVSEKSDPDRCTIYNYVSSVEKHITWSQFMELNLKYGFTHPLTCAIWYVALTLNKSSTMNKLYMVLLHLIPAIFIDTAALCVGSKPRLLKTYRKIHKFSSVLSYFCTHQIKFTNNNVRELWNNTNATDRQLFPFSMCDVVWREYFSEYIKGLRLHLFKESDDTLTLARVRWRRFYILHQCVKIVLVTIFSLLAWKLLSYIL